MSEKCDPKDIALKSLFLGPQAENGTWVRKMLGETLERWFTWRKSVFPGDGPAISQNDQASAEFLSRKRQFEEKTNELMTRFEQEVPKFSPRYIGHMFSEVSLPALFGHIAALLHNPNNISEESSRVGVQIEKEAIDALIEMVSFPAESMGHFTSGGTIANFEAIVRARNLASIDHENILRDGVILVPDHKHYSWIKGASLVGFSARNLGRIALDAHARLSIPDLKEKLTNALSAGRPVVMVVSVAGTTELGSFDPIGEVQDLVEHFGKLQKTKIWHHVDAAYGGFFRTIGDQAALSSAMVAALQGLPRADSVTLDPHKLGYVPYACGAFLVRNPENYKLQCFGAPYVGFDEAHDRGLFTLEGSRSATGAAATWMIARTTGLHEEGYGRILTRSLGAKHELKKEISQSGLPIQIAPSDDSNILCFHIAQRGESISQSNERTLRLIESFSTRHRGDFFVSMTRLGWDSYGDYLNSFIQTWSAQKDAHELVLVRLCLMNPFFDSIETHVRYPKEFVAQLRKLLES